MIYIIQALQLFYSHALDNKYNDSREKLIANGDDRINQPAMVGLFADHVRRDAQAAYLRYRAASAEQHRNAGQFNGPKRAGKCYPNASRYGNQRTCAVSDLGNRQSTINQNRLWYESRSLLSPYAKSSD